MQLRHISSSYNVEGFMVLVSRLKSSITPKISTAGSVLGERFLDLFSREDDPCAQFTSYVCGQKAIKDITGQYPLAKKRTHKGKMDVANCRYDLGKPALIFFFFLFL